MPKSAEFSLSNIEALIRAFPAVDTVQGAALRAGTLWRLANVWPDVDLNDNADLTITTAAAVRVGIRFAGIGEGTARIYEGPTVVDGTPLVAINPNRSALGVAPVSALVDPTVNDPGALLTEFVLPGGGGASAGWVIESLTDWIWMAGTSYLLRLTSAIQNNTVSIGAVLSPA